MTTPQDTLYRSSGSAINQEINTWRKYFLDDLFEREFKHVSEEAKRRVSVYFFSIPSESFTTPLKEFHKCIGAIIQHMEERG